MLARWWHTPQLLLCVAVLGWSGNFVVGRLVGQSVPPVALGFARWLIAVAVLLPFGWRHLRRDLPVVRRRLWLFTALAITGITIFNTFVYIGLGTVPAVTGLLLQSAGPLLVLGFVAVLFREHPTRAQLLGLAVSLLGVWVIVSAGHVTSARISVGAGAWWILAAVVCYALYTALLRLVPGVHPLTMLLVTFGIGVTLLAPFAAWEFVTGRRMPVTPGAVGAMLYVGLVPSIVSYFCWNRGVALLGSARAGQFMHLMPIFGAVLAFLVLGEALQPYHLVGGAIIAAGLVLAGRRRRDVTVPVPASGATESRPAAD